MTTLEKLQPILLLAAVGTGIICGQLDFLASQAGHLVTPLLMAMLFSLFWDIPLKELGKGFLNIKFAIVSLCINFIWIPILGWFLGQIFLSHSPALLLGYLMLCITPCTDWYLVFTSIAGGNTSLSASILPINLIVQLLLMPVYLLIFAGLSGSLELMVLIKSIILVLFVPFGLVRLLKLIPENKQRGILKLPEKILAKRQFLFLWLAIAAMFASQSGQITEQPGILISLLPPTILFFALSFVGSRIISHILNFSYPDSVSLTMTTLARNSPIALAIAVNAFPSEPLVALALVIGPMIELPVLAIISQILIFWRHKTLKLY